VPLSGSRSLEPSTPSGVGYMDCQLLADIAANTVERRTSP
jgi:hypothetical protein